jgi:hypothetical protein
MLVVMPPAFVRARREQGPAPPMSASHPDTAVGPMQRSARLRYCPARIVRRVARKSKLRAAWPSVGGSCWNPPCRPHAIRQPLHASKIRGPPGLSLPAEPHGEGRTTAGAALPAGCWLGGAKPAVWRSSHAASPSPTVIRPNTRATTLPGIRSVKYWRRRPCAGCPKRITPGSLRNSFRTVAG